MSSYYVKWDGGETRGFKTSKQAEQHAKDTSGRLGSKAVMVLQDLPFQADPIVSTWKNGRRR